MSVEVLRSTSQAIHMVRRALMLDLNSSSDNCFELLRSAVWSMAAPNSKVHINRLIHVALPTCRLVSDVAASSNESLRAELRQALSILEGAGDLIELSGGYWAPATARFVPIPDGTSHLLVGGVPSAFLQLKPDAVQLHGPHRHIATLPSQLTAAIFLESFTSWARLPRNSLEAWAHEVVESLERQPYTPTSLDAFDFYVPSSSRSGASQFNRWSESVGNVTGTVLARRRRLYGGREYRLVDVRAGRVISICELHDIDVRRLMYAHDIAAKNPTRARQLRNGHPSEWLLTSEIPRGEQRAFAAFGTLTIPGDRPFERRWKFLRNEELALGMLRSLGIVLEESTKRGT